MTDKFIFTDDGAVNLRHVVKIIQGRDGNYKAELTTGEMPRLVMTSADMDRICEQVVPASGADKACVLTIGDIPPGETLPEIFTDFVTVIAWGISYGTAIPPRPIVPDALASNQHVLTQQHDGKWCWADGAVYETLESAKADLANMHKKEPPNGGS